MGLDRLALASACMSILLSLQFSLEVRAQHGVQSQASLNKSEATKRIEPAKEYEKGLKLSQLHKRPMLVIFGAEWCNWCRKLEGELASDDANETLEQWIIAKVDVDEESDIATEMHVSSLPALRVLGPERDVVASKEGYLSIADLKEWLKENLLLADPKIQRVLYEAGSLNGEDLKRLVEFLGHRSASIRSAAQKRLSNARDDSEGMVVDALRGGRLAQQLCAMQILQSWQAPVASVDPWRPATINSELSETLVQWLRRERDKDGVIVAREGASKPLDEAKVLDLMARLLAKRIDNREGLMAEAVSHGDALVPEVRLRLANVGELDDSNRQRLRELLYQLLVGDKLRLEMPTLLAALASLNAETHRSAALNLLASFTSQDQPMVDELSQDADPLVREATVSKLQELGELQKNERLQRLLADKSPSVRTAVLRQLSEHPLDTSIARLIEYTDRETDEDLLVYATKTLGQLGSQAGADEALIRLAKNISWRVRAAALDAIGQVFEKQGSRYGMGKPSRAIAEATAAMAKVILEAAQDSDQFVVERAVAMIPKIIEDGSASFVLEFFAKNPKRLTSLDKTISGWRADETLKPLVSEAERWLDSKAPEKIEPAVNILTRIKPSALKLRVPELLDSEAPLVRLGALSAAIASFAEYRDEKLKPASVAISNPRLKLGEREPWHHVPESFQYFPKASEELDENKTDSTEEVEMVQPESDVPYQVEAPDLLDDFFGPTQKPAEAKVERKDASIVVVDDVLSLFGGPETQTDAPRKSEIDNLSEISLDDLFGVQAKVEAPETPESSEEIELPSEWLLKWQNDYKFDWRSEWALEIRKKLHAKPNPAILVDESQENGEGEMVMFAGLASGEVSSAPKALASFLSLKETGAEIGKGLQHKHKLLSLKDVVAWLPAKARVEFVTSTPFDWRELSKKNGADFLEAATIIDEIAIADWIFEGVRDCELTDVQWALVRKYLLRALLGARADSISTHFTARELRTRDVYSQFRMTLPRIETAVDWLSEHYTMQSNDATKGMLLNALSYMDHGLAVQSSIGRVAEATEWNASVRVALAIALWDRNETSVDRAIQLLEHPLLKVRQAALMRLSQNVSDSSQAVGDLQTTVYYDYQDRLPGLWYAQRPMPEIVLREFAQADESTSLAAKLLLLSIDKISLNELGVDAATSSNRFKIAVSLVKAKQTNGEAVAFYKKSIDQLMDDDEIGDFYRLMRTLLGDEISEIRATMRKRFSASALRN